MGRRLLSLILLAALWMPVPSRASGAPGPAALNGAWVLVREKSPDIDLFGTLSLRIRLGADSASVEQT